MDPQSLSFTPRDDIWRFYSDMLRVQQTQADHAERLLRLERRQDEDARVKSVWGASSPFPSVLSGQVGLHNQSTDNFPQFDDQQSNLIGSLHLDADDEPRRTGATSRANSVRFDESANQGWAHASRTSIDLIPRVGSGLGGHAMTERSFSHKSDGRSDGRQSSAGHSVHSVASGRANSFGLDTPYGASHSASNVSPIEPPGVAPGLFILGPVPAIVRCWLNTNFKHESLLYAAVCSGSFASLLDMRLIDKLGFREQIYEDGQGNYKIKLAVYLPEAIPYPGSSRPNSPVPQLPSVTVEFNVVDKGEDDPTSLKAIQIVLGSDMLRACNADILFSTNTLTLFDEERAKLSIPLVRPEDDCTFKTLFLTSGTPLQRGQRHPSPAGPQFRTESPLPGQAPKEITDTASTASNAISGLPSSIELPPNSHRQNAERRNSSDETGRDMGTNGNAEPVAPATGQASRPIGSPATWSNWRRDSEKTTTDWSSSSRGSGSTYQRRDQGIKVLKPMKMGTRSSSSTQPRSPTASTGQSRFFDEGRSKARSASTSESNESSSKKSLYFDPKLGTVTKEQPLKKRSTNPVGEASAFAWLNTNSASKLN